MDYPDIGLIKERIGRYIDRRGPDECWLWLGSKSSGGYGEIGINNRNYSAHRLSFLVKHGSLPPGLVVRHKCDTPACVNPAHLLGGTQADNMRDKRERLRATYGAANNRCRHSAQTVTKIRELYASGLYTMYRLGKMFGIERSAIRRYIKYELRKFA